MDLIKLAEDLHLTETKTYKYRISEHRKDESTIYGYMVERYNKNHNIVCSITISHSLLSQIMLRKDLAEAWVAQINSKFDKTEWRLLNKKDGK